MPKYNRDYFADIAYFIINFIAVLVGIGILGWQVYYWLKNGVWANLPLALAFEYFGFNLNPIFNPVDWHGLAKIAAWLLNCPLAMGLPALIWLFSATVKEWLKTEDKNKNKDT